MQQPATVRRPAVLAPTLRGYRRTWLGADLVAGVSAGAVVIPQAMAYATIAELPVEVGLYTCIAPMLVYALIGGSRAMSVSTTSTIATLTATTLVSSGVAAASTDPTRALTTLTLLVGVILLLARVFRLGALVENINLATLIGIKVGLGATVALGQVPKLLGVDVEPTGRGFFDTLVVTVEAVPQTNPVTVLLSAGSIAVMLVLRRVAPRVPAPLVVVVAGMVVAAFTPATDAGLRLIAPVPSGLPGLVVPDLDVASALVPGALAIAVMAFLESASVARGIREPRDPQIDSNRELLATGAANVVGAFTNTLPAAGGFSQSAVNRRAGARSQLSAIVTALLAVLVALVLAPLLELLPQATLAAMVFVAVVGLVDVRGMARLARINRVEFWIAVVVAGIGLVAGLLPAVAAGVLITLGLVLHELNRPRLTVIPGVETRVVLDVPLYTANVLGVQRAIEDAVTPDVETVVLDASIIRVASVTVLDSLAELDRALAQHGVRLEISGLAGEPLEMARRTAWWRGLEGEGRIRH